MTKKKRRNPYRHLRGCPVCGGAWGKESGLTRCAACGHCHDTVIWDRRPRAGLSELGWVLRAPDPAAAREVESRHPRGRRLQPLTGRQP